jgi:hypothetical protein
MKILVEIETSAGKGKLDAVKQKLRMIASIVGAGTPQINKTAV